jgi:hypothetical protein
LVYNAVGITAKILIYIYLFLLKPTEYDLEEIEA